MVAQFRPIREFNIAGEIQHIEAKSIDNCIVYFLSHSDVDPERLANSTCS